MKISKSTLFIVLWVLWLCGFMAMPLQSEEQYRYQLFPDAVVVLDTKNLISLDLKNENFGQLGQYKFSLDGTGIDKLVASKLYLAKDNFSDQYVLLVGKISVKYKAGIDIKLLAQDYGLSVSSHFPKIRRVYLRVNTPDNLQDLNRRLLKDDRVLRAKLDRVDYNQSVR